MDLLVLHDTVIYDAKNKSLKIEGAQIIGCMGLHSHSKVPFS